MKNKIKTIINVKKEIEIRTLVIKIQPRSVGDSVGDDMPPDCPFLSEDKTSWEAYIDIDTGNIHGWPKGEERHLDIKVCDTGIYRLLDSDNNTIASLVYSHVPHGVIPGEYCAYIELDIDENGIITNWPKKPDVSEFFL